MEFKRGGDEGVKGVGAFKKGWRGGNINKG